MEQNKRILESINSPDDLKKLLIPDLKILISEIREEIIKTVARTGGHLGANLGVVELTVALLYTFDCPGDKIIWDVGHQSYTYKLLTGRRERFHTLRQYGGISGFPSMKECNYDAFGTGHSSTSVSAASGLATALKLSGNINKNVIAVIGDGALTAGLAFEGLNFSGHVRNNLKVIVNDNTMSISRNVGALGGYLTRIITAPWYNRMRKDMEKLAKHSPAMLYALKKTEENLKNIFTPGILFEELGYRYFGPIDGHNVDLLITTFKRIKNISGPLIIHILTKKGKGFLPAENYPEKFHGVGKFDTETGEEIGKSELLSYTEVFGKTIIELAKKGEKIIAITAAMPDGTGLSEFAKIFPDRFFDVGIAEQHAVTFAAGLAAGGYKPFVAVYSTFLQRAYDQIIHDVCIQNLPVVFCVDRAGIVGSDGVTHQGIFDISYLRAVPNLTIMVPKDEIELQKMMNTAYGLNSPAAIRYPRGEGIISREYQYISDNVPVGQAEILEEGNDAVILGIGPILYQALKVADDFRKKGLDIGVINMRFIKPIDKEIIKRVLQKTKYILTVEENVLHGGFGSAVLEAIAEIGIPVKTACLGLPDNFVEHGSPSILKEKYGIDKNHIKDKLEKLIMREGVPYDTPHG